MKLPCVVLMLVAGGCARGALATDELDAGPEADGRSSVDAAPPEPTVDASPPVDAAPGLAAAVPLMLTEVVLAPNGGEMIEIANPSGQAVDLSSYYLSDAGAYFRLPGGAPALDTADFIVKFPAGAMIPAQGVVTVALDTAANFTTAYGAAPTYSIASGTMAGIATSGTPNLTNAGELVVLFHWDGQADLVRDVDMIVVGVPTAANGLLDKSGAMVDGPDANTTGTAYATDARTLAPQASAPAAARSTKRVARETGHETQGGTGNGLTGDDETSEDTSTTWDTTFTAPTPGSVPAGLL